MRRLRPIRRVVLTPLFLVVRWFGARLVSLFYREVKHSGRDQLPQQVPIILAANHPNSVMDPIVLMTSFERPVHFLARAGLFRWRAIAWLLKTFHAIPVQRQQDGGDMRSNDDMFAATHDVLGGQGVVGIFPHGQNVEERRVEDIRSGAARIALGAESAYDWSLGLVIVPVGMNYEDRDRFNSRLLVRWGEPILVSEYAERYRQDPKDAVHELTQDLLVGMRSSAVHLDETVERDALDLVRRIYAHHLHKDLIGDEKTLEDRFFIERRIGDAMAWARSAIPDRVDDLLNRMERHHSLMQRIHLRERVFKGGEGNLKYRRRALKSTVRMILGLPLATWGVVHNLIPYQLTVWLTRFAAEEAIVAVTAFLSGIFWFGLWYLGVASALYSMNSSVLGTLLYAVSIPGSGLFAVAYLRWLRAAKNEVLAGLILRRHPALLVKLRQQRDQIIADLNSVREDFLNATGSEINQYLEQRSSSQ